MCFTMRWYRCDLQVVSWDEDKGTVDTNYEDGRSYISCLSEVIYDPYQTCNGTAKVATAGAAFVFYMWMDNNGNRSKCGLQ